ncbi:MAG: ligand-binding protein SH3 [Firmicutes bacterium HGW-Firmicutes-12]|nr:MAG: ligand-binding protein SH3 [Firmicutes bacterium HGW-Firmicutes-12]
MTITDWQVFFLSALPLTELRATIPLALALGLDPVRTYLLAVLGNILPVVPLLFLLQPISDWMSRFPLFNRIFTVILTRSRHKGGRIQKYGVIGLLFFVAIPLPGTGAWTGAFLAWLLGMDVLRSILAVCTGVLVAGIIVTLASLGVIKVALIYDLESVLLVLVVVLALFYWYKSRKKS